MQIYFTMQNISQQCENIHCYIDISYHQVEYFTAMQSTSSPCRNISLQCRVSQACKIDHSYVEYFTGMQKYLTALQNISPLFKVFHRFVENFTMQKYFTAMQNILPLCRNISTLCRIVQRYIEYFIAMQKYFTAMQKYFIFVKCEYFTTMNKILLSKSFYHYEQPIHCLYIIPRLYTVLLNCRVNDLFVQCQVVMVYKNSGCIRNVIVVYRNPWLCTLRDQGVQTHPSVQCLRRRRNKFILQRSCKTEGKKVI